LHNVLTEAYPVATSGQPKEPTILAGAKAGGAKKAAALRITAGSRQVVLQTRSFYVSHTNKKEKEEALRITGVVHTRFALHMCSSYCANIFLILYIFHYMYS
jgi:hypothetical protein